MALIGSDAGVEVDCFGSWLNGTMLFFGALSVVSTTLVVSPLGSDGEADVGVCVFGIFLDRQAGAVLSTTKAVCIFGAAGRPSILMNLASNLLGVAAFDLNSMRGFCAWAPYPCSGKG